MYVHGIGGMGWIDARSGKSPENSVHEQVYSRFLVRLLAQILYILA